MQQLMLPGKAPWAILRRSKLHGSPLLTLILAFASRSLSKRFADLQRCGRSQKNQE